MQGIFYFLQGVFLLLGSNLEIGAALDGYSG